MDNLLGSVVSSSHIHIASFWTLGFEFWLVFVRAVCRIRE